MQKLFVISFLLLSFNTYAESYSRCSGWQKNVTKELHRGLVKRVRKLTDARDGINAFSLTQIKRKYINPQGLIPNTKFKRHDQTYSRFHSRVKFVLDKMRKKVDGSYTYVCMSEGSSRCRGNGGVLAYVLNLGSYIYNKIYLCPLFFQSDTFSQEETLMHELSHLGTFTDHYFGTSFTDEGMVKSANDAFLYGRMAHGELENLMRFNSWGLMWRKP